MAIASLWMGMERESIRLEGGCMMPGRGGLGSEAVSRLVSFWRIHDSQFRAHDVLADLGCIQ